MVGDLTISQLVGLLFGVNVAAALVAMALGAMVGRGVKSFLDSIWPLAKEDK
jgi:hypothetical protein